MAYLDDLKKKSPEQFDSLGQFIGVKQETTTDASGDTPMSVFSGTPDPVTGKTYQRGVRRPQGWTPGDTSGAPERTKETVTYYAKDGTARTARADDNTTIDNYKSKGYSTTAPISSSGVASPVATGDPAIDEEAIRQRQRESAEKQIAEIDKIFAARFAREKEAGTDRLGQTRAMGARSGVMGQDFGAAQKEKTTRGNEAIVQAIGDEKAFAISQIFDKFDARAEQEIADKTALAVESEETRFTRMKEAKTEALADFMAIAAGGLVGSYDEMSDDDKALMQEQTGKSNFILNSIFNSQLPQNLQHEFEFKTSGDTAYIFDKTTGTITETLATPPDSTGWDLGDVNGVPHWLKVDDNGNVVDFEPFDDNAPSDLDIMEQEADIAKAYAYIDKIYDDINSEDDPYEKALQEAKLAKITAEIEKIVTDLPGSTASLEKKLEKSQSVLDAINAIDPATHSGFNEGVGFNILGGYGKGIEGSQGADYIAQFDTLKGLLTLDNLGIMKGVLSDADIKILTSAATSLSTKMSQKKFKSEWANLKEKTALAIEKLNAASAPADTGAGDTSGTDSINELPEL